MKNIVKINFALRLLPVENGQALCRKHICVQRVFGKGEQAIAKIEVLAPTKQECEELRGDMETIMNRIEHVLLQLKS